MIPYQKVPYVFRSLEEINIYLDNVKFSIVDVIGDENVKKCQKLADSMGIYLRVRKYEG